MPHHCDPALLVLEELQRFVEHGLKAQAAADQVIASAQRKERTR